MTTLEDWLQTNANDRRSKIAHKVQCPSEEARKLIKGILCGVADFHSAGYYHGALYESKNYMLTCVKDHDLSRGWSYEVELAQGAKYIGEAADCQKFDTLCVRRMIFGRILQNDPAYNYLQDLDDCLGKSTRITHYLADHPSVWHWKDRFDFFLKLAIWRSYNSVAAMHFAMSRVVWMEGFSNKRKEIEGKSNFHTDEKQASSLALSLAARTAMDVDAVGGRSPPKKRIARHETTVDVHFISYIVVQEK